MSLSVDGGRFGGGGSLAMVVCGFQWWLFLNVAAISLSLNLSIFLSLISNFSFLFFGGGVGGGFCVVWCWVLRG